MDMRRQLLGIESDGLAAPLFSQGVTLTHVDRHVPAQVWQREVYTPIAPESRAEKREERLILVDRQELSVAHRPTFRREAEAHDSDFGKEWFSHGKLPIEVSEDFEARSFRGRG